MIKLILFFFVVCFRGAAKVVQTKSLPPQQLLMSGGGGHISVFSDDEPIYDHVASDDDYYNIPEKNGDDPVRHKNAQHKIKFMTAFIL